jgi:heat shock protein HslJ
MFGDHSLVNCAEVIRRTMKRSVLAARAATLCAAVALAATIALLPLAAIAQESTPETVVSIPPMVWELTAIETVGDSPPILDPTRYTIQFLPSGRVAVGADCNRGVSTYELNGSDLSFDVIATTLALCAPESRSDEYLAALAEVTSFSIDQSEASDQLLLGLESGGTLRFSPSLVGVIWQWESFQGGDGAVIAPDDPSKFALEFQPDGTVSGQIDCNRAFGSYTEDGSTISLVLATTRMYCGDGSLDADFGRFLAESTTFVIRDGRFSMALPMDGGITTFTAVYDDSFGAEEAGASPEAGA